MEENGSATSSTPRLEWLDALRGWAIFVVLVVHSGFYVHGSSVEREITDAGQYGVQLFFMVSALTISMTYESHIRRFGRSVRSQSAWLIKRFFRIAPLYYLAACFYPAEKYGVYIATHHRLGGTTSLLAILANLLFLHAWIPSANTSVVPGGWSIGVEMFFYLLVPFIWLIVPVRRRIAVLCIGAIVFLTTTFVVSWISTGSFHVANASYLYFWFPTQAPVIVLGIIFYFIRGPRFEVPGSRIAAGVCLACFSVLVLVALDLGTSNNIAPALSPTILAVSFILLILSLRGWIKKVIVNRFAVFLGKISFSVYIVHFAVLTAIDGVIVQFLHAAKGPLMIFPILTSTLGVSIALAMVSKRVIEDPAITYGHKLSQAVALARRPQTTSGSCAISKAGPSGENQLSPTLGSGDRAV